MEAAIQLDKASLALVLQAAEIDNMEISTETLKQLNTQSMSAAQFNALQALEGRVFTHRWQLDKALAEQSGQFRFMQGDEESNADLHSLLKLLHIKFRD